jgi:hypothetical protein
MEADRIRLLSGQASHTYVEQLRAQADLKRSDALKIADEKGGIKNKIAQLLESASIQTQPKPQKIPTDTHEDDEALEETLMKFISAHKTATLITAALLFALSIIAATAIEATVIAAALFVFGTVLALVGINADDKTEHVNTRQQQPGKDNPGLTTFLSGAKFEPNKQTVSQQKCN